MVKIYRRAVSSGLLAGIGVAALLTIIVELALAASSAWGHDLPGWEHVHAGGQVVSRPLSAAPRDSAAEILESYGRQGLGKEAPPAEPLVRVPAPWRRPTAGR